MPISDTDDYPSGHFNRVYLHLLRPAIEKAGFEATRADEIQETNFIVLDIVQHLLSAEMCICDLSSKNPNVLYELGIRQAFNLPVCLIKDDLTSSIFDIQGFRECEYSSSLRIDEFQKEIAERCNYGYGFSLEDAISESFHDKTIINEEEVFSFLDNLDININNAFLLRSHSKTLKR